MADETQQQDGQKTIVSFVVGLLIGGMLVWAFSGPAADAPTPVDEGDGSSETTSTEAGSESDNGSESGESNGSNTNEGGDGAGVDATGEATPEPAAQLPIGDGSVVVPDQAASDVIALEEVTYPISEGWIGVRDYNNDQLGPILGVMRFSEAQGLIPERIQLLRPTVAGSDYAVVFFTEDGDREFNPAGDTQIGQIFATFTAE